MNLNDALARIAVLERENLTLRRDNAELREENAELRAEVRRLNAVVDDLTRKLEAVLAALDEGRAETLRAEVAKAKARPKPKPAPKAPPPEPKRPQEEPNRHAHGRGALPEGLPRDEHRSRPERCDRCGSARLKALDTEVTEAYNLVRSHIRVRRIVREVCRCADCHARVSAAGPPMPWPQALCTAAMLAYVIAGKYSLHLPLQRLRKELNQQGARLSDATLGNWMTLAADAVEPVLAALKGSLLDNEVLMADATGLRVLEPGQRRRPAKRAEVLVWCTPSIAFYDYAASKHGHLADAFLVRGYDTQGRPNHWEGTLVVDGEGRFSPLFTRKGRIRAGCNAHARRKLRDAEAAAPGPCAEAMRFYAAIYAREREAKEAGLSGEALREHRQRLIRPLYEDFHAWLLAHREDFDEPNAFRMAIDYVLRQWPTLVRWLDDPRLPPDNNLSERQIKPIAMGRRSWLFAGSEEGAKRAVKLLSLVETCKLNGVDPQDYLTWLFERLDRHPEEGARPASALMPWDFLRWKAERAAG